MISIRVPPHVPTAGCEAWASFPSELLQFLSTNIIPEPELHIIGDMSQHAASAKLYMSLVAPVQELSDEYQRRYHGVPLCLSLYHDALVVHGTTEEQSSGPKHFATANALKGYVMIDRDELLCCEKLEDEILHRVAGYIHHQNREAGQALLTSLNRTWFFRLTPEDQLLTACVSHTQPESAASFLQVFFFFMHLVQNGNTQMSPARRLHSRKRKLELDCSAELEEASVLQARSLRKILVVLCRSLGFKFQEIEEVVTLQLPVTETLECYGELILEDEYGGEAVYRGVYEGKKSIFKTVDVCKVPERMKRMVREVWVMHKLRKLQGDLIPRLYAAGYLNGGAWVTILEDVGKSGRCSWSSQGYRSTVAWLHASNLLGFRKAVMSDAGKIMFTELERACLFQAGDDHPDEFLHLALQDLKRYS